MFNSIIRNGKKTKLYYHRTDGGAEYLFDKYVVTPAGTREGTVKGANIVIRIDGGELEFITKMEAGT